MPSRPNVDTGNESKITNQSQLRPNSNNIEEKVHNKLCLTDTLNAAICLRTVVHNKSHKCQEIKVNDKEMTQLAMHDMNFYSFRIIQISSFILAEYSASITLTTTNPCLNLTIH